MIKTPVFVTGCLFIVVSASSAALAQQSLSPWPAHAVCLASASPAPVQGDLFTPKPRPLCGLQCRTNEGGTTSTLSGFGGTCATSVSALTSELRSAAKTACNNLTGFNACNVVVHDTGCLPDGDPNYYIDQGYATYNCNDTSC
jgi:hypothetical protein